MPSSILEITERLEQIIDGNGSVQDMATATDAISTLERTSVTRKDLEETRLGLYVNKIRRASRNSPLAKRAKNLIKTWQQLIEIGPPLLQQTRPETPNSVGSSPSPPEPLDYNSIRNYSQLPSRSSTPTLGGKKLRKHKITPGVANRKNDVPDAVSKKGQSKEHGLYMQVSSDTGKPTVLKPNGLKAHASPREPAGQSTSAVSNSSKPIPSTLMPSKTNSKLSIPHKSHKKKKGRKSPHKVPSPATTSNATEQAREDAYNNNEIKSIEHGIKGSKSTPNLTVNNTLPVNNKKIAMQKSYNDLKRFSSNTEVHSLKRKREQSAIDAVSPERSSDKPRAAKERRLTFDPTTGELKRVPSDKLDARSNVAQSSRKSTEKTHNFRPASESEAQTPKSAFNSVSRSKVFPQTLGNKMSQIPTKKVEPKGVVSEDVEIKLSKKLSELPTRLSPSVDICGGHLVPNHLSCSSSCSTSSNFYEARREFRKRKTRRKHPTSLVPTLLYPISNLVQTLASDSEENSDFENGFCEDIKVQSISESKEPSTHSLSCNRPGVTGCRGNDGSWYNWMETFCVNNHKYSNLLPEEKEILPLQILPYVELD